jgi:hypothetical protein
MDPLTRLLACALLLAAAVAPSAAAGAGAADLPDLDADDDRYPDAVEAQTCSRETVRNLVNDPDVPGSCASNTDFVGPFGAVYPGLADLVDGDRDTVPDALEPSICQVESQGDPTDGECSADGLDYDPPLL